MPPYISPATLERIADQQIGALGAQIGELILGLSSFLLEAMVFFLSLYLFVAEGDRVYHELVDRLPLDLQGLAEQLAARGTDTLYAIYVVEVAIAVITFLIAIPFFIFLGYGHVLFLAAIAGIFQLVPILGQWFIMLILGIYALAIGDLRGAVIVAFVGYPLVSAFPDVYLRPVLSGRQAGIHPVVMWIGIFGGLEALGAVGFVLGPLILTLFIAGYRYLIDRSGAAASNGIEPRNRLPPTV
jgi:predicted PurR-regulated permease PerM